MTTKLKATLFAAALALFFLAACITAIMSAGPIVLGTELNTNGLVEYLCLGRGCEDFTNLTVD